MVTINKSTIYKFYKAVSNDYFVSPDNRKHDDELGTGYQLYFSNKFMGFVYPESKVVNLRYDQDQHVSKIASLLDLADLEDFTINI